MKAYPDIEEGVHTYHPSIAVGLSSSCAVALESLAEISELRNELLVTVLNKDFLGTPLMLARPDLCKLLDSKGKILVKNTKITRASIAKGCKCPASYFGMFIQYVHFA